jgi:hypothetical protein
MKLLSIDFYFSYFSCASVYSNLFIYILRQNSLPKRQHRPSSHPPTSVFSPSPHPSQDRMFSVVANPGFQLSGNATAHTISLYWQSCYLFVSLCFIWRRMRESVCSHVVEPWIYPVSLAYAELRYVVAYELHSACCWSQAKQRFCWMETKGLLRSLWPSGLALCSRPEHLLIILRVLEPVRWAMLVGARWNGRDAEERIYGLLEALSLSLTPGRGEEPLRTSVRIVGVPAGIRACHFPNTRLQLCRYDNR